MKLPNAKFLTQTPWKCILRFSVPMFLGSLLQQAYNMADSVIAGKFIGKHALASVSACGAVMFLLASLFMGVGIGATSIISQYYGAKDHENLRKAIDTFMLWVYISGFFFLIFGTLFASPLLRLLNTPDDIFVHARSYLTIIFIGGPVLFAFNATVAILHGVGDSKTPLKFSALGGALNVLLNILFVSTTNLGVAGLALATSIAYLVTFILCVIYLNTKHPDIGLHFRHARLSLLHLKNIIRIGVPSGVQQMGVSLGFVVIQSLINTFGSTVMAGVGAAERLEQIIFAPIFALGGALSAYVGQNIGAGNMKRVHQGFISTIIMVFLFSAVLATITVWVSPYMLKMFNNDPNVIAAGVTYLQTIGPFYVILGISFTLLGVMRGAGATLVPMILGLIAQVALRAPLSYLFVYLLKSPTGIWLAIPTSWVFSSLSLFIYYSSGKWKKHIAVKKESAINLDSDSEVAESVDY